MVRQEALGDLIWDDPISHHGLTHDFTAIDPCVAAPLIRLVICWNLNIQLSYGWQPYFNNFGADFERWIHIISRNVKLCVIQNGFFSQFFNIGTGCRQGDPISPYLFLLCVEILGVLIRKTKNIKGINISDVKYKLFQFADDMRIFLDGSENS